MNEAVLVKLTRYVLAIGVSLWISGGCLFGCSTGEVRGAEVSPTTHGSHTCCTRPKPKKVTLGRVSDRQSLFLAGLPNSIKDCPLAANATAITAKQSGASIDASQATIPVLPILARRTDQNHFAIGSSQLPNREGTYLRCCVFLI